MEKPLFSILFDDDNSSPANPSLVTTPPIDTNTTVTDTAPADPAPANTPASTANPAQQTPPAQQPQPSNPGKMLVCAGATCVCTQATSPTPIKLQVVSQQKFFVNDADGSQKFLATTKEKDILALNFGSCKNPSSTPPPPCSAQLEWKDFYEGVELPGGAYVLTEKSTATCIPKGGTITIINHGQQIGVTTQQLQQATTSNWTTTNPLAKEEDVDIVQQDSDNNDEKGASVEKIQAVTASALAGSVKTYPVHTTVAFQVSKYKKRRNGSLPTEAEKKAINWVVYDKNAKPVIMESDLGPTMSTLFRKPGEYIIEAYGEVPGGGNSKKAIREASATCRIRIQENGLSAVKINGDKTLVRVNDPLTFTAALLFSEQVAPLPFQSIGETSWKVGKIDSVGNLQQNSLNSLETKGSKAVYPFPEKGKYIMLATLNGITHQSPIIEVIQNRISKVTATKTSCRAGDRVVFSVADGFVIHPPLPEESAHIQWMCKDEQSHELVDFKQPGSTNREYIFQKEGKYTIYAYLNKASEEVCAKLDVQQPKLTHACWKGADETVKTIGGWDEKSTISLRFKACQGLKIDLEVYARKPKLSTQTVLLTTVKDIIISETNYVSQDIVLKRTSYNSKLAPGDELFFIVKTKTPGYTIEGKLQEKNYLRLDTKENITRIVFYKEGKQVNIAYYGDQLKCRLYTRNLIGKELKVGLYQIETFMDIDNLWLDKEIAKQTCSISETGYGEFSFTVSEDTGKHHVRAQVACEGTKYELNQASFLTLLEKSKRATTTTSPGEIAKSGSKEKKEKCLQCDKDISLEDIKKICVDSAGKCVITNDSFIKAALPFLNRHKSSFGLDTCCRKAHFLAQIATETKFYMLEENNFNYAASVLKAKFSNFQGDGVAKADQWGRPDGDNTPVSDENQIKIANWAYANINGNKAFSSGDGYAFRGRGFIQLTGRGNYKDTSDLYNKWMSDKTVDWEANPTELASNADDAIAAAIIFWRRNSIAFRAEYADEYAVESVTRPINAGLNGLAERKQFFKEAVKALKVEECENYKARKWRETQEGTIVVVSGIASKLGEEAVYVKRLKRDVQWPVYETRVWRRLTLEKYKELKEKNELPDADYVTYLSRDGHGEAYGAHSKNRYGTNNECPPGEYYLNRAVSSQKYRMYIGDSQGLGGSYIAGPPGHGSRAGIAIHGSHPIGSIGCLTTHSAKAKFNQNALSRELFAHLPDLDSSVQEKLKRSVRIILEEREVIEEKWHEETLGDTKWSGFVPTDTVLKTNHAPTSTVATKQGISVSIRVPNK
jgi:predicted chitinase